METSLLSNRDVKKLLAKLPLYGGRKNRPTSIEKALRQMTAQDLRTLAKEVYDLSEDEAPLILLEGVVGLVLATAKVERGPTKDVAVLWVDPGGFVKVPIWLS